MDAIQWSGKNQQQNINLALRQVMNVFIILFFFCIYVTRFLNLSITLMLLLTNLKWEGNNRMGTFLLVIWLYMGMLDAIIIYMIIKYGPFCVYLLPKCCFCIFSGISILMS